MPEDLLALRKELTVQRDRARREELPELIDELLDRWEREQEETNRRLNRLTDALQLLDARLLTVENSRVFRALQRFTSFLGAWSRKGRHYVHPSHGEGLQRAAYQAWLERRGTKARPPGWFRETAAGFGYQPRFTLLLHLNRPRQQPFEAALESILEQSYPNWELCCCDDANSEPWIASRFESLTARNPRVHYVRSEQPMGAVSSLNRAGMLGSGDYVACVGQHDVLAQHALFHLAEALQFSRHDLLYGDEDRLNAAGVRDRPVFKPAWSPDLLLCCMYLGNFFAVSREGMDRAGWFRQEFEGAHLYDLALRAAERPSSFQHVPHLLYSAEESSQAPREQRKHALSAAIQRRGLNATINETAGDAFVIRRKLSGTPLASIVICSRNPRLLRKCLRAIDSLTAYPVREVVVVQHKTGEDSAMERLLASSHCIRLVHSGAFDFAAMNNRGALAASGEVLVYLNDDVEPLSAEWLNELVSQVQRPEVGVVGAKLLYPSGAVQHAGIALGMMDGAGHPQRGTLGDGFWPWSGMTRNVTAVTGACMAVRRRVFEELNGFDLGFPVNYNDVDLCLRARQAGYDVICEASAVLRHQESQTRVRGVSWEERERFHARWGKLIERGDPYYNPHLTRTREDCSLNDV